MPAVYRVCGRSQLGEVFLAGPLGALPERADVARERFEILARDLKPKTVARVHIRSAEKACQVKPDVDLKIGTLVIRQSKFGKDRRILRNKRADGGTGPCAPATELVEVVQLGQVRGEDHEHRLAERLNHLVEFEADRPRCP